MKLSDAHTHDLTSSKFITEAGEAPRWSFPYSNWKHDHTPSILLLGAYTHPTSGNNLVGGINLNYLTAQQRDDLARKLPQLMTATNLYQRCHLGKQIMPDIFKNYYRTYDSKHIRGVDQSVLHPRYGVLKTTKNFLQKKVGGLFKSKARRAQDAQPKFPSDLSNMKDTLDQTVNQLGLQVASAPTEPDTPEIQMDRANQMATVKQQEDEPFIQATQSPQPQNTIHAAPELEPTPPPRSQTIEQEREENQRELLNQDNAIDLDGDGIVDESIVYYCPRSKQYLVENLDHIIDEWNDVYNDELLNEGILREPLTDRSLKS